MTNTEGKTLVTRSEKFYLLLVSLYPEAYQKRFGKEMLFLFNDMYHEEIVKNGRAGAVFWLNLFFDTLREATKQHISLIRHEGIKKYFHINWYNIVGLILLFPFFILLGIDLIARVVQGDLFHYIRAVYQIISHSFLYASYQGQAPILWLTLVISPILAIILNLIHLFTFIKSNHGKRSLLALFFANPLAIIILGVGFLFLLVVFGHDFFPCMAYGLLYQGVGKFVQIISICRNA